MVASNRFSDSQRTTNMRYMPYSLYAIELDNGEIISQFYDMTHLNGNMLVRVNHNRVFDVINNFPSILMQNTYL
jgi:hypothetical protein